MSGLLTTGILQQIKNSAVGGTWLPSDLASLAAWYDASDTATITHSSGAVSQLNDKEGSNHLTQATGSLQPATGATTQNGLNVLDFNGDALSKGSGFSFLDDYYQDHTIFYVVKGQAASVNIVIGCGNTVSDRCWYVDYRSSPKRIERINDNASLFLDLAAQNTGTWSILGTIGDGTNEYGFENGTAGNTVALSGTTETNGNFTIGRERQNSSSLQLVGSIAEVIICNAAVSSTDREKIEGYLANKWGLTANLPALHPYKSVAP